MTATMTLTARVDLSPCRPVNGYFRGTSSVSWCCPLWWRTRLFTKMGWFQLCVGTWQTVHIRSPREASHHDEQICFCDSHRASMVSMARHGICKEVERMAEELAGNVGYSVPRL